MALAKGGRKFIGRSVTLRVSEADIDEAQRIADEMFEGNRSHALRYVFRLGIERVKEPKV